MDVSPRVFSGIQPTGPLGLGHYVGALRHWLPWQDRGRCLFAVVDSHALTVDRPPATLRACSLDLYAWYVACGLDPERSILFCQSHVAAHAQLAWALMCATHMGELTRMTQFKDKSQRPEASVNAGLFTYPVLMAADVLLYETNLVPVGADQKQHLELTRDLAIRLNQRLGQQLFTVPEPAVAADAARLMSLQDPTKKMSKSDPNQHSWVAMSDTPDQVVKKIKRAVTDSEACVAYAPEQRPGISNLVSLFAALSNRSHDDITSAYEGQGYGVFKADLADCIVGVLAPIQVRFKEVREDADQLMVWMADGAERARSIADPMCARVYEALGCLGR